MVLKDTTTKLIADYNDYLIKWTVVNNPCANAFTLNPDLSLTSDYEFGSKDLTIDYI